MCCLSTQKGQITAWLIKSMIELWPQNFWLGIHPSSGSVHDASLSREPGWLRSCLPSDERHVGFWTQSDACPPPEHLFAKACFSVISSILSFFFSFGKGTINIGALYCFIGFSNKRKTTPNSVTLQMTFLLSFFDWSCSALEQQGPFCIWLQVLHVHHIAPHH